MAPSIKADDFKNDDPLVRLDLGCGANKRFDAGANGERLKEGDEGYKGEWIGVDSIAFEGVDQVVDLCKRIYEWQPDNTHYGTQYEKVHVGYALWPWEDNSVDEIHASHFIEHFGDWDRVHVINEMYRVLKPGGKATVVVPSWTSARAYGDPTHQWPPLGMYGFWYWDREWRLGGKKDAQGNPVGAQAPHTDASNVRFGYDCDFEFTAAGGMHPEILTYPQERQMHMMAWNIEAVQDIHITLTKRPKTW